MSHNLGNVDRIARLLAALGMLIASVTAPVQFSFQVGLALMGVYMIITALVGTCLGYKLIGVSTCPIKAQRAGAG